MPAAPNSPVDIFNLALTYVGQRAVRSLESPGPIEQLGARVYDGSRQYCLTLGAWTFATKQAAIPQSANAPLFGFLGAFELPGDFISLVSVLGDTTQNNPSTRYRVLENQIYYNSEDTSISIEYVFDQTNVARWSPAFKELVAYHIAKTIAYDITKKKNVVEMIETQYKAALMDAVIKDGQDEPPERIERSRALEARLMGGSIYDDASIVSFDD